MARRLEGRVFLTYENNGVWAITPQDYSEETSRLVSRLCDYYDGMENWTEQRRGDATETVLNVVFKKPVFTFANEERVKSSPWFDGSHHLARKLCDYIKEEGGIVREAGFYVPFSNGNEAGFHGLEALGNELRWVTTNAQFLEEFGISPEELIQLAPTV